MSHGNKAKVFWEACAICTSAWEHQNVIFPQPASAHYFSLRLLWWQSNPEILQLQAFIDFNQATRGWSIGKANLNNGTEMEGNASFFLKFFWLWCVHCGTKFKNKNLKYGSDFCDLLLHSKSSWAAFKVLARHLYWQHSGLFYDWVK